MKALDAVRRAPTLPLAPGVAEEGEQLGPSLLQTLGRPRAALVPLLEEGRVRAPRGATLLGEDDRVVVVAQLVMQSPRGMRQQVPELVHGTSLDRRRRPRPFDGGPQPLAAVEDAELGRAHAPGRQVLADRRPGVGALAPAERQMHQDLLTTPLHP